MKPSGNESLLLRLPAPAKINVFLKVLNRRDDGYHNLQTLFHFIDACDVLEFYTREQAGLGFSCSDRELETEDNLVMRAAQLMWQEVNREVQSGAREKPEPGIHIHLEKHLPTGGGLGGGSSDAATCMLALKQIWDIGISQSRLLDLGLSLGADVPVFLLGKSALGTARGEALEPFLVPPFYYLIVKPACHVSTKEVFQHRELTRDSSPRTIRAFPNPGKALQAGSVDTDASEKAAFKHLQTLMDFGNDCQSLVRKLHPEIDSVLSELSQFSSAQLSGTGACVFAPFESRDAAEKALSELQEKKANSDSMIEQILLVKGLNDSPLQAELI